MVLIYAVGDPTLDPRERDAIDGRPDPEAGKRPNSSTDTVVQHLGISSPQTYITTNVEVLASDVQISCF